MLYPFPLRRKFDPRFTNSYETQAKPMVVNQILRYSFLELEFFITTTSNMENLGSILIPKKNLIYTGRHWWFVQSLLHSP